MSRPSSLAMEIPLFGKVRQPSPWLLGLLAAGLLGVGGIGYVALRNTSQTTDISGMTVPVESKALTVRITASGAVQPVQTVNLSPKTAGILAKLYVEQGDCVTQGQVIARMEDTSLEADLLQARARIAQAEARYARLRSGDRPEETAQARAAVEQAQARVVEAQSQLKRATERVERNRALEGEGAISQDAFDAVLTEADTARAVLEQTRASLREAQQRLSLSQNGNRREDIAEAAAQVVEARANLKAVETRQEDTLIRAPFDGIITQKYATEGAFVTPTTSASEATSATSTAIVALAEGLEVLAEVPEVDIQQLKKGQPVEVVADAYPDKVFRGEILLIAPEAVVKQNVTSFQVRVKLLSGQDTLLSGMNVDLTFLGDTVSQALVVPTVAIVTQEGETGVLVPNEDNEPTFQPVVIGTAVGDQTQIIEGLDAGDRIFTDIPETSDWAKPDDR